ncbi:MAG: DUF2079 domain-containing protein [Candidatus Lernaella stagnicola]|nr:DUF2079 domain-containing protein [Candidatus Lernaella stagnicola]
MDSSKTNSLSRWFAAHYGVLAAGGLALAFFGVNLWLQVAKWHTFHYATFDYANVMSILDEVRSGRFDFLDAAHLYGAALCQAYVLYFLCYFFVPSPYTLMVIVAAVFGLAVFCVYVAARPLFRTPRWPLLLTLFMALNPFLIVASLAGFRQNMIVVPAALLAFAAYQRRRPIAYVVAVIIACAAQANITPGILLLGFWILWRRRDRWFGRATVFAAAGWLVLNAVIYLAVRSLSDIEPPANMLHLTAYGESPVDFLRAFWERPGFVLENLFYWRNGTFLVLLLSLAGLPLISPAWLIAALPELGYMLVSTYGLVELDPRTAWAVRFMNPLFSHFNTGLVLTLPFFIIASLEGAARLGHWGHARWGEAAGKWAAVLLVLAGFLSFYFLTPVDYGPVPLTRAAQGRSLTPSAHDDLRGEILDSLDANRSYLMQFEFYFFAPRVRHRALLSNVAYDDEGYDFVLVDEKGSCPHPGPAECAALRERLTTDPRFELAWDKDGIRLYRPRATPAVTP